MDPDPKHSGGYENHTKMEKGQENGVGILREPRRTLPGPSQAAGARFQAGGDCPK